MTEIRILLFVFVWELTVLILFVSLNTIIVGEMVPILEDTADNITAVDAAEYRQRSNALVSIFYVIFGIMMLTPIVFLIVRLLYRREPTATGGFVNAIRI